MKEGQDTAAVGSAEPGGGFAAPAARRKPTWKSRVKMVLGFIITVAIFVGILKPVYAKWPDVRERVLQTNWWLFAGGAAMFAAFLLVFRALAWRHILQRLGHRLPVWPATRIWSTSELARYLPGVIWQVVGRVYLVRPYGVSGSVCSASQVLELTVFLLANILLAVSCLCYNFTKMGPEARPYLFAVMALVPVLLVLLHPKVFYGLMNRVMRRLGKPALVRQLPGWELVGLVAWSMLGLLFQALALWLILHGPLHLKAAKWWIVAGAYGLAWCGGFLAFWAPGGLGVREFIFVYTMRFALPRAVRHDFFNDETTLRGFLAFLGVLLRLWATLGELILTAVAYAIDYRGALGRADAPGRIAEARAGEETGGAAEGSFTVAIKGEHPTSNIEHPTSNIERRSKMHRRRK